MRALLVLAFVALAACQSIAGIDTKVPPDDASADDAGAAKLEVSSADSGPDRVLEGD